MAKTTTAAIKQALGAYGETLAARHLVGQGMVLLDRNWRCEAGEIDLVLRDGDVLVVCEVKTRSSLRYGTPHEAVDRHQGGPAAAAGQPVGRGPRRCRPRHPHRPGRHRPAAPRRLGPRPRAGDRLMPFATAHTVSLHGAVGHLIDVQTDVSPGQVGVTMVGRPDTSLNEARDRCGWRSSTATSTGRPPGGSRSCCRRPTCSSAAPTSTSPSRSRCWPPRAACRRESLAGTAFIGELTLDGNLRSVTGVLPMVLAAAERGIRRGVRARAAGRRGGDGPRHERDRGALARPGGRRAARRGGPGGATGRTRLRRPAAGLARAGARWRSSTSPTCSGSTDTRYAVEVAAAGGHHLLLSGPKGAGKTSLAERIPGILPDLDPSESLELTALHSLAGTLDPAAGMLTRPPFSAPHHDASKASIVGGGAGMVRPGEVSRAHRGVLFLDEFPLFRSDVIEALRQPLESGDVTIARARRVGDAAGPRHGRARLQPVPVRRLHRRRPAQPVHLPRRCSAATTATRSPARSPTGSTSSATCRRCGSTTRSPTSSRPSRPRPVRRAGRGGPGPAGRAVRRAELAAQRPGARPGAARAVAADQGRSAGGRRPALRRPAQPPRRDPGAPARLDGRRPARPRPAGPRRGRHRAAAADRRPAAARRCWSGSDERARDRLRRPTPTGWPGSRCRRSPSPATRGWPTWSPSSARWRCATSCSPSATSPGCRPTRRPGWPVADPERTLADGDRLGLRFVVPGDAEWPAQLDDLHAVEPLQRPRRRAARALGARPAAPRHAARLRSPSSGRARRRRTAPTSPPRSAPTSPAPAGAWSPARRSASTRPPTAARWRSTARASRCWPAAPTGSTRSRTPGCSSTSPPRARSCPSRRPDGRRPGSGSCPATG